SPARRHVRRRHRGAVMGIAFIVFLFVVVLVMGTYAAITYLPDALANREMNRRLRDVSTLSLSGETIDDTTGTVVRQAKTGPLPFVDRLMTHSGLGQGLARLIDRSGVETTPSAIFLSSIIAAMLGLGIALLFTSQPFAAPLAAVAGLMAPFL